MSKELAGLLLEQRRILQDIESIYSEVVLLERAIVERQLAISALNAYKTVVKGRDALVPIGGNIYLPSRLIPDQKALIGVGANVYLSKEIDEALSDVQRALENLNNMYKNRLEILEQLRRKYDELTAVIAELRMKQEGKK
jgi:prefoldin alpha subunit